jgi:hypothetical protein
VRPKRNISIDKVSLEIDLEKLFGKKIVDPGLRRNIAEALISKIDDRVSSGKGVDGNGSLVKLKAPYSKMYAESPEFKAFGKSKNQVNMKLTGSMMASIDMISDSGSKIEIGIDNEESAKAYNHMVGDTVPRRPFLGLTSDDIDSVANEFKDSVVSDEKITAKNIFDRTNLAKIANIVMSANKIGLK